MAAPSPKKKLLGEMLMAEGLLTQVQLNQALAEQRSSGKRLGAVLKDLGLVTEQDIIRVLGSQMGIEHQSLSQMILDQNVVKLVPEMLARRHHAIALYKKDRVLTVAMVDPLNVFALDDLGSATGLEIKPVVSTEADVRTAIDRYYSMSASLDDALKDLANSGSQIPDETSRPGAEFAAKGPGGPIPRRPQGLGKPLSREEGLEGPADDTPIIKLVNAMIAQATREGASDIHVEPGENQVQVRFRVDGVLRDEMTFPKDLQAGMISRIKVMAEMDIAERRVPQDGRLQVKVGEKEVDIRVSTLPVVFGEKIVMRLLDKQTTLLNLDQLGFAPDILARYQQTIRRPYGLVLVVGPTGSGKTTTLYGTLNQINSTEKNIVTVEDPVEYRVQRVNQVQVNVKAGVTFATGLRSILRQDPDVVMIGEIRDLETAAIAVQSAMTGHMVFSTLHTNDAPSAVARLTDMGVEPFLIASSLSAVIAQRLIRRICKHCKTSHAPDPALLKQLGLENPPAGFMRGSGCEACRNTGYSGRIGLFELLIMDDTIRHLTVKRASASELRAQALKKGFRVLRQDGLQKALQGLTTLEEVLRGTQDLDL